jgi:hypothetical protein
VKSKSMTGEIEPELAIIEAIRATEIKLVVIMYLLYNGSASLWC